MPRATPIPIPALAPDESPFECPLDGRVAKLESSVVLVSVDEVELVVVRIVVRTAVITELSTICVASAGDELEVLEVVVADTLPMEVVYEAQRANATDSTSWATGRLLQQVSCRRSRW
jgi:hypothetical protein